MEGIPCPPLLGDSQPSSHCRCGLRGIRCRFVKLPKLAKQISQGGHGMYLSFPKYSRCWMQFPKVRNASQGADSHSWIPKVYHHRPWEFPTCDGGFRIRREFVRHLSSGAFQSVRMSVRPAFLILCFSLTRVRVFGRKQKRKRMKMKYKGHWTREFVILGYHWAREGPYTHVTHNNEKVQKPIYVQRRH